MDWPLSFAISIPSASAIIVYGKLMFQRRTQSDDSVSRRECKATTEGIRNEMTLTREVLVDGFKSVRDEIRSNRR